MKNNTKRILNGSQAGRSRKRKERKRQILIYKGMIGVAAVLIVAGIGYLAMRQIGRREPDMEETQIEQMTEAAAASEAYMQSDEFEDESTVQAEWPEALREYGNPGICNVSDYLNIREAADEGASIIGRLPADGVCEILEEGETFYRIQSGEAEGYVNRAYLLTGEAARDRANQVLETRELLEVAVPVREEVLPDADSANQSDE